MHAHQTASADGPPAAPVPHAPVAGSRPVRWLAAARVGWLVAAVIHLALAAVAIPVYVASLQTVCTAAPCAPWQLTAEQARALAERGLSVGVYAGYLITLQAVSMAVFWLVALVLFWRRSGEPLALFVSLTLVLVGTLSPPAAQALAAAEPDWGLVAEFAAAAGWASFFTIFFYLFPDGQFVPRWTRWCAAGFFAINIPAALSLDRLAPDSPLSYANWPPVPAVGLVLALVGAGVFAQVYRYRRHSTPVQRQQTKWLVFAVSVSAAGFLGLTVPGSVVPALGLPTFPAALYGPVGATVVAVAFLPVPLALGGAILRYRLWDIDFIINRTLVYAMLTAALALIYLGSVVLLQYLFRLMSGQTSELAIIISTLAIAALFQPLRRRIQGFIDRRFYRRTYDAARTLAAFSARLRDEVDLPVLQQELIAVVQETMQPSSISLWIRPSSAARRSVVQGEDQE